MTLPVRVGVRVTLSALHTTLTAAARVMTVAGDALQSVTGHDGHPQYVPSRGAETAVEPEPVRTAEPEPEPAHVSEEPELVAEIAEPGAEDGAESPWD